MENQLFFQVTTAGLGKYHMDGYPGDGGGGLLYSRPTQMCEYVRDGQNGSQICPSTPLDHSIWVFSHPFLRFMYPIIH